MRRSFQVVRYYYSVVVCSLVKRCVPGWVTHMATEGLVRAAAVCSEVENCLVVDVRLVKV